MKQEWEYQVCNVDNDKGMEIEDHLNRFGSHGWEVFQVVNRVLLGTIGRSTATLAYAIYMKRKKLFPEA